MHACSAQPHGDLRSIGGTVKMQFAGEVAAPSRIGAGDEASKLTKLSLLPIEVQMKRHLAEQWGPLNAGLDAHDASLLEVQAHVSSGGLATQANAPLAGILLPQRKIGVHQRKRKLFRAVFEID